VYTIEALDFPIILASSVSDCSLILEIDPNVLRSFSAKVFPIPGMSVRPVFMLPLDL
jgi:hypothetical protein